MLYTLSIQNINFYLQQKMKFLFFIVVTLGLTFCTYSQKDTQPIMMSAKEKNNHWNLIWEDSFTTKDLDTSKWSIIERNNADWGNYMSSNKELIRIKREKLHLGGIVNNKREGDTVPYLTGGIMSKGKFAFKFGKIEIRAKLEQAQGAWPALWMLADQPQYGSYPRNGEIDLMEHLNYDSIIYQTVHSYYTLNLGNETNPLSSSTSRVDSAKFNTYAMEWFSDKLIFSLNGKQTFTYPKLEDGDPSQWPFDQPFYILMDMQLGGKWVGKVEPKDLPVKMIVDWVRVYKRID
jgi:beta-glucanase (GH16 family)